MTTPLGPQIQGGARARRPMIVLTLNESVRLLDFLAVHPDIEILTRDGAIRVRDIPVHVLDPMDEPDLDYLEAVDDPRERAHLASYAEGIIDADDARRLLQ